MTETLLTTADAAAAYGVVSPGAFTDAARRAGFAHAGLRSNQKLWTQEVVDALCERKRQKHEEHAAVKLARQVKKARASVMTDNDRPLLDDNRGSYNSEDNERRLRWQDLIAERMTPRMMYVVVCAARAGTLGSASEFYGLSPEEMPPEYKRAYLSEKKRLRIKEQAAREAAAARAEAKAIDRENAEARAAA